MNVFVWGLRERGNLREGVMALVLLERVVGVIWMLESTRTDLSEVWWNGVCVG